MPRPALPALEWDGAPSAPADAGQGLRWAGGCHDFRVMDSAPVVGSVRAGLAPRVRREGVDPVEKVSPLVLDLGQATAAVEERVEVDLAGARDAGPDVPVDVAVRVLADRLGGLGRRARPTSRR